MKNESYVSDNNKQLEWCQKMETFTKIIDETNLLWRMLSKDFVLLVMLSSVIAVPIAYYFLQDWLQQYAYRTEISW